MEKAPKEVRALLRNLQEAAKKSAIKEAQITQFMYRGKDGTKYLINL